MIDNRIAKSAIDFANAYFEHEERLAARESARCDRDDPIQEMAIEDSKHPSMKALKARVDGYGKEFNQLRKIEMANRELFLAALAESEAWHKLLDDPINIDKARESVLAKVKLIDAARMAAIAMTSK